MSQRLKVLLSAYACEPGKGSEPEVGWQWALQLAHFHDVTVLTRANNRAAIEQALPALRDWQPVPEFVYHDESALLLDMKRTLRAHKLYYLLWQRSARDIVTQLHRTRRFDLLHHVTYAGFRFPTAIWGHGVPCVWGPIGGMESVPFNLLPWKHPAALLQELGRNYNNLLQAAPVNVLGKRARASTTILTSTLETQRVLSRLGHTAQLMPTIGLDTRAFPEPPPKPAQTGPLKLLFVGNIITLKGVDLALCALKESGTNATFTLIGDGNFLVKAKVLRDKLGLQSQVEFKPRIPREQALRVYREYDALLFPSLHDTGGYAVVEAMISGLPVICLDCGGPAIAVTLESGFKVPLGTRASVISNLAASIRRYNDDRDLLLRHGAAARQTILQRYDWRHKAGEMNAVYAATLQKAAAPEYQQQLRAGYSGVGSLPRFLSKVFSSKGVLASFIVLLLVGTLGFISTSYLRSKANDIVEDTLPSLSYAGAANANLAQGFNRTVLFTVTDDPVQRDELRREIEKFSRQMTYYVEQYESLPASPEANQRFQILKKSRDEYLQLRKQVLELAASGQRAEALAQIHNRLLPAHDRYREAGESVLSYEIKEGQHRGNTIMRVGTATQIVVAAVGVALFLLGFFIGVFK